MPRGTTLLTARADLQRRQPTAPDRPGWVRRCAGGLGDSLALAVVALLGCLAVVAVGAVGALIWAYAVER